MRITRQHVIDKCEELLTLAPLIQGSLRDDLMHDYSVHVLALKSINDPYPDEQLLNMTSRLFDIGDKFPRMNVEEIEESMVLCEILQILSENVLTL